MTLLSFSLLLLLAAFCAGLLGSLTGLGGGFIVIPTLILGFGVDIHYATGAALVASIATSSGSGANYVRKGVANIRLGMFLEVATTLGAITGAFVAYYLKSSVLAVIFSVVMLFTSFNQFRRKDEHYEPVGSPLSQRLRLNGTQPMPDGSHRPYGLRHVGGGFGMMYLAGIFSGILGIGSGMFKVIAMDDIMHVPFKVSTTTSNFMIGVTAVASALVYLQRGNIVPGIAFPVLIGVVAGATVGAHLLRRLDTRLLRRLFFIIVILTALNMLYNGLHGQF